MEARLRKTAELPPRLILFQLITGHYISRAIYVAAKLGIADLLADGPRHYEELAKSAGAHGPSLNRLLRLLTSAGVFAEPERNHFGLTPLSEWLRTGIAASSHATALLFAGPMVHHAWDDLLYSVQTGKIAFDHAFGMDAFQYIGKHPEEASVFNDAMTSGSTLTAESIATGYDFSAFSTIADVGGGHGMLLIKILEANPALRGILCELPQVAEGAKQRIEAAGLADRCQAIGGDFFEGVPRGADAYVLKSVIHDWDEERSIKILKNVHRVMPPQGKLLLLEGVLPERMEQSPANEIMAGSDVNMLIAVGGRERTDAEFRSLFQTAGFKLARILPIENSLLSIIEGVPV